MSQLWSTLTFFARLIEKQIMQHGEVKHPISTPPFVSGHIHYHGQIFLQQFTRVWTHWMKDGYDHLKDFTQKTSQACAQWREQKLQRWDLQLQRSGNLQVLQCMKEALTEESIFFSLVWCMINQFGNGIRDAQWLVRFKQNSWLNAHPQLPPSIINQNSKNTEGFPINETVCNQMRTIPTHVLYRILN